MMQQPEQDLERLLEHVEEVFRKSDDCFGFTVESFQDILTARNIHCRISGNEFSLAEFYDYLGRERAIDIGPDYLTEQWRKVISFLMPMFEDELSQLVDVILDDPLVNALSDIDNDYTVSEPPIVIQAQTKVCNAEAYFVLAEIYNHLEATYGMELICIEGAEGFVDSSLLASFPVPEIKRQVAKNLVKEGKLGAAEFVSVNSDRIGYPIILGIDDMEKYRILRDYEAKGRASRDYNEINRIARQRQSAVLRNLEQAIDKYQPTVMVLESQSTGAYAVPDLTCDTDLTIINIKPKVKGGINWELYRKVIKNQANLVGETLVDNVD